jgi:hypothetical protein
LAPPAQLGRSGEEIDAKINRAVNRNGTARVLGGAALREWFQENFKEMDEVSVDLTSTELIALDK